MLCLQLESMIHDYKHTAGSDLNKSVCLKQGTERVHAGFSLMRLNSALTPTEIHLLME